MTSIEEQWPKGTPERAVADAFSAFRRRDFARLATAATPASIRALAARVGPELDATDFRAPAGSTPEPSDSQAASILEGIVARLPVVFTDSVRCLIVGRVLESRPIGASPDGSGLICVDCRVSGAEDKWLSVDVDRQTQREIANRADGVAHVVFHVAWDLPGHGVVPFPPELQIATTQLISGEWKLLLDERSDVGLPGFRCVGFWIDESSTTEVATDD
jgi:hypothetical protein